MEIFRRFEFRKFVEHRFVQIAQKIYLAAFPLLLFFALETLNPAAGMGLFRSPLSPASLAIFLLSAIFIALIIVALFCITTSLFVATNMASALFGIIYVVNNLKIMVAGNVFVPTDLSMLGGVATFTDFNAITIERTLLARVFLIIIMQIPIFFASKKIKFALRRRLIGLTSALALFVILFASPFAFNRVFPLFGLDEATLGSLNMVYRDKGVIIGFYAAAVDLRLQGAAATDVAEAFFADFENPGNAGISALDRLPNVIVIMSEAWMDPTVWPNVEFSQDPAPNFRRLSAEHRSGNVVVPVFGGGTANTEFEFLTGSAIFFTGSAMSFPFEQTERFFSRDIPTALPWLFRANGYRAVAVHPYYETFFRRNHNYPLLGFQAFYTMEDMPDAPIRGYFISDEYFTDRIIVQIDQANADDVPLFLFGISMQNHWGFTAEKYAGIDLDVTASSPRLTRHELEQVNSYLQGVFDADYHLGRLIEHIEEGDVPTMVVFFGDHLPVLGVRSNDIFEHIGFLDSRYTFNWYADDLRAAHSVPYLIWTNFEVCQEPLGDISTYFLGAVVARDSGIVLNQYYSYLLALFQYFRALTEHQYADRYGNFSRIASWILSEPHVQAFQALQHSNLHGVDAFHRGLRELVP